jgi:hypothetical protein
MPHTFNPTTPATPLIQAHPGGGFMPISLMPFTKPAIDIDAKIALLRARGLTITDEARARHYLYFIAHHFVFA